MILGPTSTAGRSLARGRVGHVRISVVQERLNRILDFVLYGMAAYLHMKPSVQAASTRLCCEVIVHSVFALPEPLPSASYCMLFRSSPVTAACSTAILSTGRTKVSSLFLVAFFFFQYPKGIRKRCHPSLGGYRTPLLRRTIVNRTKYCW